MFTDLKHLLCCTGLKYTVGVVRTAHQGFRLTLGDRSVDIVARKLKDGGLLCQASLLLSHDL